MHRSVSFNGKTTRHSPGRHRATARSATTTRSHDYDRPVDYATGSVPTAEELVALYSAVGWTAYTEDPAGLLRGVSNSTFVSTARNEEEGLVGLARVLSDDMSIVYVQDVLVDPNHQRKGVGRQLLKLCLDRYAHVRQRMLLTDDEEHQHRLYKSLGFHDVSRLDGVGLHAFVDIVGADLTSS